MLKDKADSGDLPNSVNGCGGCSLHMAWCFGDLRVAPQKEMSHDHCMIINIYQNLYHLMSWSGVKAWRIHSSPFRFRRGMELVKNCERCLLEAGKWTIYEVDLAVKDGDCP